MSNTVNAYSGNEPYIFISYSHKDSSIVLPAIEAMQQQGYRIWFDRGIEAGTEWSNNIAAHLRDCAVFVAFVSKNSVKSENCLDEIAYAKSHGKPSLLIFLEENVTLPEGTEMQTARFQRMFYNRQSSLESFIENICAASILLPCRGAGIVFSAPIAPKTEPKAKKQSGKNLLVIIGAAVALVIIVCLIIALASKGDSGNESSSTSQEVSIGESIAESGTVSEESSKPAEVTMSENIYDCTFILEGDVYQLPCSLNAFTSNGWAITTSGYSSDRKINGLETDSFIITKDGKKASLDIINRSGNASRLDECPVIGISVTVEYGASIELAKGITLNSTIEQITEAYGTPFERDSGDLYEAIMYVSETELTALGFDIYTEQYSENTCIELLRYKFEDTVTTETNTALPEFISQYSAPTELGSDILSCVFKLEEDLYRLPAPVKAFLDNGWSIASSPEFIPAGAEEKIKISKNGGTIEVDIVNLADYQTTAQNCVVTNVPVYDTDNVKIELPGGISFGSSESELDTLLPADLEKTASQYSVSYNYTSSTPREIYIYLYIDIDSKDALNYIRLNSTEWDYKK